MCRGGRTVGAIVYKRANNEHFTLSHQWTAQKELATRTWGIEHLTYSAEQKLRRLSALVLEASHPEQPNCTPKRTLSHYPHVSTEPLHTIIVLTPHFTNKFTPALVYISHRHKQNPPAHRHQGSTVIPTRNPRGVVTTKRKCYMHTINCGIPTLHKRLHPTLAT